MARFAARPWRIQYRTEAGTWRSYGSAFSTREKALEKAKTESWGVWLANAARLPSVQIRVAAPGLPDQGPPSDPFTWPPFNPNSEGFKL